MGCWQEGQGGGNQDLRSVSMDNVAHQRSTESIDSVQSLDDSTDLQQKEAVKACFKSAKAGNTRKVEAALEAGHVWLDSRNHRNQTLLHTAARNGKEDLAKMLLARGADAAATDSKLRLPSQLAATGGHTLVQLLLEEYPGGKPRRKADASNPSDSPGSPGLHLTEGSQHDKSGDSGLSASVCELSSDDPIPWEVSGMHLDLVGDVMNLVDSILDEAKEVEEMQILAPPEEVHLPASFPSTTQHTQSPDPSKQLQEPAQTVQRQPLAKTHVHTTSDVQGVDTRTEMESSMPALECGDIIQIPNMDGCETNTNLPQPSPVQTPPHEEIARQQPSMEQHSIPPVVAEPSAVAASAKVGSTEDVFSTTCDVAYSSTASAHGSQHAHDAVGATPQDTAAPCVDALHDELRASAGANDAALAVESDDGTLACVLPPACVDTPHDVRASRGKQPCAQNEEAGREAAGVSECEGVELEARQDASVAAVQVLTGEAAEKEEREREENTSVETARVDQLPAASQGGKEEEESCASNGKLAGWLASGANKVMTVVLTVQDMSGAQTDDPIDPVRVSLDTSWDQVVAHMASPLYRAGHAHLARCLARAAVDGMQNAALLDCWLAPTCEPAAPHTKLPYRDVPQGGQHCTDEQSACGMVCANAHDWAACLDVLLSHDEHLCAKALSEGVTHALSLNARVMNPACIPAAGLVVEVGMPLQASNRSAKTRVGGATGNKATRPPLATASQSVNAACNSVPLKMASHGQEQSGMLGGMEQWTASTSPAVLMNGKHGDWTLRSIRRVKPTKSCVSPRHTDPSRLPAALARRGTDLDSLLPRALSPRRTSDGLGGGGGQGHNSSWQSTSTGVGQSSTSQSNLAMSRQQQQQQESRRKRGKEAVRLGVAALHDALIDAAWAGYRRARDGQAARLVLHVEMRYGQRCINIVHDAKKYQALMHKMGEHVQASPSLLNIKVLCNVAEILAHHIEIPTPRLGSFEVSAVWLSGCTVVRHVVLYSKLRTGLFPCVLHLVQAVEAMVCTVSLPRLKLSSAGSLCPGNTWETQPSATGAECAVREKAFMRRRRHGPAHASTAGLKYNFVGATLHGHTQALWDVLQVRRAPDASLSQWGAQDWVSESKNVARDTVFVAGASSLDGSKSARLHVEHSPLLAGASRRRRHRPASAPVARVQSLPHVTQNCINPTAALAPMADGMPLDVTCPQHEYEHDESRG